MANDADRGAVENICADTFEYMCREFELHRGRSSEAERAADLKLSAGWLQSVHKLGIAPFYSPMLMASLGYLTER